MDEKKLYVLALFDDETSNALNGVYGELLAHGFTGTQTKDIPYHFTLRSWETSQEDVLTALLDRIASNTERIHFYLSHLGLFGLNVLFAEPNINYELLDLLRNFSEDYTQGCHNWVAHATILIDEPEIITQALPIAAARFKPMRSRIEKLALYEFFPTRHIKTVSLK